VTPGNSLPFPPRVDLGLTASAADGPDAVGPGRLGPLAIYGGDRPPAPEWFGRALDIEPEVSFVDVDGAAIEVLTWGRRGAPGLLFLHGMTANAWWWSFIAPFFADTFRCVALSWSGMGRSGRRDQYSITGFAREIALVSQVSGLFDGAAAPVAVAHSFAGVPLAEALNGSEAYGGAILIDRSVFARDSARPGPPVRRYKGRLFDSRREALARFRLLPDDPCPNDFIVDHVARSALTTFHDEAGRARFGWDVDPAIRVKLGPFQFPHFEDATAPLAFIWGERSSLVSHAMIDAVRRLHPTAPHVMTPEAGHHVMLDQPLALVTAIRALLAQGWLTTPLPAIDDQGDRDHG